MLFPGAKKSDKMRSYQLIRSVVTVQNKILNTWRNFHKSFVFHMSSPTRSTSTTDSAKNDAIPLIFWIFLTTIAHLQLTICSICLFLIVCCWDNRFWCSRNASSSSRYFSSCCFNRKWSSCCCWARLRTVRLSSVTVCLKFSFSFDRFRRAVAAAVSVVMGTGLGLDGNTSKMLVVLWSPKVVWLFRALLTCLTLKRVQYENKCK